MLEQFNILFNNFIIMENKYKIKIWATVDFLNGENSPSSSYTAKFISKLEWKKIFVHKLDDNDDSSVWVSQYEKTEQNKIPVNLIEPYDDEEIEKTEPETIEEIKNDNYIINKIKSVIKQNYLWIIFGFILCLFLILWFNNLNTKEANAKTWNLFDVYSDRIILIEKKENFELEKQKKVREEKRKENERLNKIIKESIEAVKILRIEKDEIAKQKLELAK